MILFSNVIRHVEINLRKNTKDLYCETIKYQLKNLKEAQMHGDTVWME